MEKVAYNAENVGYKKSDKLIDVILRQELESFTPNCNLKCALICHTIIIILFIAFGVPIIVQSNSLIEYSADYTNCNLKNNSICELMISINQTMQPPINLYYSLTNFYLNQRDLVRSRSYPQLRAEVDKRNLSRCDGAKFISEIFDSNKNFTNMWNNTLGPNAMANPCGLQAKAFFTDAYTMYDYSKKQIFINESSISNDYDRNYLFKRDKDYQKTQWLDVENEHFIVWMQMESFPDFTKMYGRIQQVLYPGDYTFKISAGYNVSQFGGTKSFMLTTTNSLGRASFFGYILITAACVSFVMILALLAFSSKGSPLSDYQNLKW